MGSVKYKCLLLADKKKVIAAAKAGEITLLHFTYLL